MIFGRPGSGKSTLALRLHQDLGWPLFHLDKYFYQANWVERDHKEFLSIQSSLVDKSSWIIDGNSIRSLEMRYQKAHLVLFVNFPRWLCYWRIVKRFFNKNSNIDDRCENFLETIRWSLIRYMWSYDQRVASHIEILKSKYPSTVFIKISNNTDVNNFLSRFSH